MRHDDVGGGVDVVQRFVEHRQRPLGMAGRELVLDADDHLAQLLRVGLGRFQLAEQAGGFALGLAAGVVRLPWALLSTNRSSRAQTAP